MTLDKMTLKAQDAIGRGRELASEYGNQQIEPVHILLALVMDTFDGKVAKLMHQANSFGKQLDSLADLISFGVAPAAFYYSLRDPGVSILLILILFTICGMLRLARYNISDGEGFEGMPITVNGFVFPLLYLLYLFHPASLIVWPATYASMSVLMVSSLRFKRLV